MKQIVVNVMPEEIRMALLEDGILFKIELERPRHSHLVGNIYKGQVQNVLQGMQAAFVDIGQDKNAFLYIGDGRLMPGGEKSSEDRAAQLRAMPWLNGQPNQRISVGQSIPVQITKDEVGSKGPRATMHLSIPGRNVVLMPTSSGYVGMSHRLDDEQEKKRLHDIVRELCPPGMGMIIRTAAEGQSREAIEQDIKYLTNLWQVVLSKFKRKKGSSLLYRDADMVIRMVRDNFTEDIDEVIIDDAATCQRVRELVEVIDPELAGRIKFYEGKGSVFNYYHVEEELAKLKERTVELKSGGFLVIDKTEAMTVIDVNTGKYVGNANLGETVYRMNLEAADEIMRQLKLRDIGGIIIVDFIDMDKPSQKEELLNRLREQAQRDRTKTNIVDITSLGLVEITRKKSRHNLDSMLFDTCPVCGGTGQVESVETLCIRIAREIRRLERKGHSADGYELQLCTKLAQEVKLLEPFKELSRELGISITVEGRPDIPYGAYSLL